jgi:F-type H+-transporting ATPase subunit gamma
MTLFAGRISAVRVVYMKYFSAGKQVPTVMHLLPFESEALEGERGRVGPQPPLRVQPDAEELLAELVPAAVKAVMFQAFNDAIVSRACRPDGGDEGRDGQRRQDGQGSEAKYNRARQAQITTELTEIVSGAAALG